MAGEDKYFEAGRPPGTWVYRSPLQRHTQSPTLGVRSLPPQGSVSWSQVLFACGSQLCLFLQGMHIFIVKPQWMSADISSAERSPVKFPLGHGNISQAALDWSLKAVVFAALRHRSYWGFFVPKPAGLCTQFCSKSSSVLHCFKSFSTGCMRACNVL